MKTSFEELLYKANEIYARRKLGSRVDYVAPEIRPQIQSDQVLAVLEVLVEELQRTQRR